MSSHVYVNKARELGAREAMLIQADWVVTGQWVRLKCQYGCGSYGKTLMCPPYAPTPTYTQKVLEEYARGLLLMYRIESGEDEYAVRRRMKLAVADLERGMFLDGYYGAFGMSSGPCNLCDECDVSRPCLQPRLARPAMEACGIDVYATLRNAGLKLEVVTTDRGPCTFCGLVLFELRGG